MIERETVGDVPDTRYDDLITRLRVGVFGSPDELRAIADDHSKAGRPFTARVLRVVADVIA